MREIAPIFAAAVGFGIGYGLTKEPVYGSLVAFLTLTTEQVVAHLPFMLRDTQDTGSSFDLK